MGSSGISIIIPVRDRAAILRETLRCIETVKLPDVPFEVIIVYDGVPFELSGQGITDSRFRLERNAREGVSGARNFGARLARYDRLLFMDADILIDERLLRNVVSDHDRFGSAIIANRVSFPPELAAWERENVFGRYKVKKDIHAHTVSWIRDSSLGYIDVETICALCFSVRRSVFDAIGGFDEAFLFGCEDLELSIRARAKGFRLIFNAGSLAFHNELDRRDVKNWMERQERAIQGVVQLDKMHPAAYYVEMRRANAPFRWKHLLRMDVKRLYKHMLYPLRARFVPILEAVLRAPIGDGLKFRCIDFLVALYIYAGFRKYGPVCQGESGGA